jgi:hypothetical protein
VPQDLPAYAFVEVVEPVAGDVKRDPGLERARLWRLARVDLRRHCCI